MPSWLVTTVVGTLVATLIAVAVTPGSTAPWSSLIVPVMEPRSDCADAAGAHSASATPTTTAVTSLDID